MSKDDDDTCFCESHPNHECITFCKTCNCSICIVCVSIKHKSHELSELSDKIDLIKGVPHENVRSQSPMQHEPAASLIDATNNLSPSILVLILAINIYCLFQRPSEQWTEIVQAQEKEYHKLLAVDNNVEKLHKELEDLKKQNDLAVKNQKREFEDMIGNVKKIQQKRMDNLRKENDVELQNKTREFQDMIRSVMKLLPELYNLKKEIVTVLQNPRELEEKVKKEEQKNLPDTVSDRKIFDVPPVSSVIRTGFRHCLYDMAVTDDKRVWVGGRSTELKLFDLQGTLHRTVPTPWFSESMCMYNKQLVYSDSMDNMYAVQKVSDDDTVVTMFTTGDWVPNGITSSTSGDLLVCLFNDDQSKVVRYSGTGTVLQEIQYDSKGRPLYDDAGYMYIAENVNGDIIVTDSNKDIVTAVDRLGVFRYSYSGEKGAFSPGGVVTDSVGHVLVADSVGEKIHMLDRDGRFLTYIIPEGGIQTPQALTMINDGEVIIGEWETGLAKIIKYLEEKN